MADQSNSFNNLLSISLEENVESPFQVKGSKNTYSILDFVGVIALPPHFLLTPLLLYRKRKRRIFSDKIGMMHKGIYTNSHKWLHELLLPAIKGQPIKNKIPKQVGPPT